jgi:hypothetical protein
MIFTRIVLFTSFIGVYKGGTFSALTLLQIPLSILTGAWPGIGTGCLSFGSSSGLHMPIPLKFLLILGFRSFVGFEGRISALVPFSGCLRDGPLAARFSSCTGRWRRGSPANSQRYGLRRNWCFLSLWALPLISGMCTARGLAAVLVIFERASVPGGGRVCQP